MISFFRRALSSKIVLALLALIGVAFVVTSFEQPFGSPTSTAAGVVATVGDAEITEAELVKRITNQVDAIAREQPGFTVATFIEQGGVEQVVEQAMNARALEIFARDQGMVASKRLVDGEIASIPAFAGPTGKFDQTTFNNLLADRRITEVELRQDFAREALTKALLIPAAGASRLPATLVTPYAALLLEKREGSVAIVPSGTFVDASAPSDTDLQAFYRTNIRRYTVPERRAVRYATIDRARFANVTATDAEIQAAYAKNAAQYAARERRRLTQVIVADEAQARAVLARVTAGATIDAAAKAAGREAIAVGETDQAAFAKLTAPDVAAAAFAAPAQEFAALKRSGLGFHVVRVDAIATTPPTPLSAVSAKLAADVVATKTTRALGDLVAQVEDAATGGSTFDELVAKFGLTATAMPTITATGASLDQPNFKPDAALAPVIREAFAGDADDDPTVATLTPGQTFALWKLDRIVPAAPRPFAQIREQVTTDLRLDRGAKAAKAAAERVVAAVNKGTPLTAALAQAGRPLPAPEAIKADRLQLAQAQGEVPPPLALLFGLPEKRAKLLPAPRGQGWFVVYVDRIIGGDITKRPDLTAAAESQLSRVAGDEYVQQFARSIRDGLGAKRDDAAIARLKATLTNGRGAAR